MAQTCPIYPLHTQTCMAVDLSGLTAVKRRKAANLKRTLKTSCLGFVTYCEVRISTVLFQAALFSLSHPLSLHPCSQHEEMETKRIYIKKKAQKQMSLCCAKSTPEKRSLNLYVENKRPDVKCAFGFLQVTGRTANSGTFLSLFRTRGSEISTLQPPGRTALR